MSTTYRVPGAVLTEREHSITLDHERPDGPRITVFTREVAAPDGAKRIVITKRAAPQAARRAAAPAAPGARRVRRHVRVWRPGARREGPRS